MRFLSRRLCAISIVLAVAGLSCHESLPLFDDPGDVFVAALDGKYILTAQEHDIWLCMRVTNRFDETLQARAAVAGSVTITSVNDSAVHRTLPISVHDITGGPYNPQTGILTIDQDSTVELSVLWDFRDDNGIDVRRAWRYDQDKTCSLRGRSLQSFIVTGQIKLIDHTHMAAFPPLLFTRSFSDRYVSPKTCSPVTTEQPCR